MDDDLHNPTGICCLTIRRSQLSIPTEHMVDHWVVHEAQKIVGDKLVLALNKQLHSPLTLAASLLRSKDSAVTEQQQKNRRKRLSVFQYLVKALSTVAWKYGPVTSESMDLMGALIRA
jgi:hypothetical protein